MYTSWYNNNRNGVEKMARVKADMIAQDIATKIKHGIYAAESFLPSENQLTELYGASLATVRKALG